MVKVNELLEKRSEGWTSDKEEAGEGLYYTEKQIKAISEIIRDPDASLSEIAEEAGVHPSYVRYIINRLPKTKATDMEWLKGKVGIENDNGPPSLSEHEDEPELGEDGFGSSEDVKSAFAEQIASENDEIALEQYMDEEGVEMTSIPIQIEVKIPKNLS